MSKAGQFLTASYAGHAGNRAYKLYIPSSYRGGPLPLIVMLHGCTQSADDFAAGTAMNQAGEEHDCLVAYPEQPKSANSSKSWNWFSPRHQHRGRGEPSLIAGITRQIMRDYAVDRRRVYAAGLSAGGAAAVILVETYPDIYAAVGVHSGLARGAAGNVPSAFRAMRHGRTAISNGQPLVPGPAGDRPVVPAIVFHGDRDKIVHPRNGERIIEQLRMKEDAHFRPEIQCGRAEGGRSYSRTSYLDGGGKALLEMWVVHEAGHAWSGGSPAGSYTDPQGPDASREMVRFFSEHPQRDRFDEAPWCRDDIGPLHLLKRKMCPDNRGGLCRDRRRRHHYCCYWPGSHH